MNTRPMNRSIRLLAAFCVLSLILAGCVPIPVAIGPTDVVISTPAPTPTSLPPPTAATDAYWPT